MAGDSKSTFGIGSSVWHFDENNRFYEPDETGRMRVNPRKQWVEQLVTGETSLSWIVGVQWRLSKKQVREGTYNVWPQRIALSPEEIDRSEWVREHRWRIAQAVDVQHDYETLRQVALTVGYKGTML